MPSPSCKYSLLSDKLVKLAAWLQVDGISFSEAARLLGVHRSLLYRMRSDGRLYPPYLTPTDRLVLHPRGHDPLSYVVDALRQHQYHG